MSRKYNPELSSVRLIEWQFFCTYTFKGASQTSPQKARMLFASLRQCAGNFGLHFKKLLWVVRSERGEITGRHHYHSLISGLPSYAVKTATCFSIMKQWEAIGGGMSRVYPFVSTLPGAEYVLKGCEEAFNAGSTRVGASEYELTKFGGSCDVTLSESVVAMLRQRMRCGNWPVVEDRHAGHTEQKLVSGSPFGNVKNTTIACLTSLDATSV